MGLINYHAEPSTVAWKKKDIIISMLVIIKVSHFSQILSLVDEHTALEPKAFNYDCWFFSQKIAFPVLA